MPRELEFKLKHQCQQTIAIVGVMKDIKEVNEKGGGAFKRTRESAFVPKWESGKERNDERKNVIQKQRLRELISSHLYQSDHTFIQDRTKRGSGMVSLNWYLITEGTLKEP